MKHSSTSSERRGTIIAVIIVALLIAFVAWQRHKDEGRAMPLEVPAVETVTTDSASSAAGSDTITAKPRSRRKKKKKAVAAPPPPPRDYLDEVIEAE